MAYFIICYDIADDKRRERVVKLLGDTGGVRVQYSVFEMRLAKGDLRQLMDDLEAIISKPKDSLILYELCATCQDKPIRYGRDNELSDETVVVV